MTHGELTSISRILHLKRLSEAAGYPPCTLSTMSSRPNSRIAHIGRNVRAALRFHSLLFLSDPEAQRVNVDWGYDDLQMARWFFNVEALSRAMNRGRNVIITEYLTNPARRISPGVRRDIGEVLARHGLLLFAARSEPDTEAMRKVKKMVRLYGDGSTPEVEDIVENLQSGQDQLQHGNPSRTFLLEVAAACIALHGADTNPDTLS